MKTEKGEHFHLLYAFKLGLLVYLNIKVINQLHLNFFLYSLYR